MSAGLFQYAELKNKLAVLNGFSDYGDQLRQKYEDPEFESDIRGLYEEMNPLYLELHAYIRRKLYQTYGPDVVDIDGMCAFFHEICSESDTPSDRAIR